MEQSNSSAKSLLVCIVSGVLLGVGVVAVKFILSLIGVLSIPTLEECCTTICAGLFFGLGCYIYSAIKSNLKRRLRSTKERKAPSDFTGIEIEQNRRTLYKDISKKHPDMSYGDFLEKLKDSAGRKELICRDLWGADPDDCSAFDDNSWSQLLGFAPDVAESCDSEIGTNAEAKEIHEMDSCSRDSGAYGGLVFWIGILFLIILAFRFL